VEAFPELSQACAKFALAIVLSGILGLERQRKGRAAGLRTHILVCLGCTLVMVVSQLLVSRAVLSGGWSDPGRMAAGILTGIGFLGAGTILRTGVGEHRGLTTAAMVWFVAGLGITIGVGMYEVAVAATIFAVIITLGLEYVERLLPMGEHVSVTTTVSGGLDTINVFQKNLRDAGFRVIVSRIDMSPSKAEVKFELAIPGRLKMKDLAGILQRCFPDADRITFEG